MLASQLLRNLVANNRFFLVNIDIEIQSTPWQEDFAALNRMSITSPFFR